MLDYKAGDVAVYKELRSLYTYKEWDEKREIIFNKLQRYGNVDVLYKEEKLYDRLLDLVINSRGLYKLTDHEKCLRSLYPKELLAKYETEVNNMASYTSDRKRYREITSILSRMQKYPDGKERVREISTKWKSLYGNRPAMMDELRKLSI